MDQRAFMFGSLEYTQQQIDSAIESWNLLTIMVSDFHFPADSYYVGGVTAQIMRRDAIEIRQRDL